jgi:hypothetical protein
VDFNPPPPRPARISQLAHGSPSLAALQAITDQSLPEASASPHRVLVILGVGSRGAAGPSLPEASATPHHILVILGARVIERLALGCHVDLCGVRATMPC